MKFEDTISDEIARLVLTFSILGVIKADLLLVKGKDAIGEDTDLLGICSGIDLPVYENVTVESSANNSTEVIRSDVNGFVSNNRWIIAIGVGGTACVAVLFALSVIIYYYRKQKKPVLDDNIPIRGDDFNAEIDLAEFSYCPIATYPNWNVEPLRTGGLRTSKL